MQLIDLRSDTVTRPDPAMRAKMAAADVGDDVYGEDPSVRALERKVAELLGKERAMYVPSGTMSNQLAIMLHTRPGDEVVVGEGSHSAWFESGAAPVLSGVAFAVAGSGGLFDEKDLATAVKGPAYYLPHTSLVIVENTHNRAGGRVFSLERIRRIREVATKHGLALHLDGARLWNASVASGTPLHEFAACADTLSVCFSKGLGAPVGSALVGSNEVLERALRYRRMLGGAMRQAGILAAGALHALENNLDKLAHDHEKARAFAEVVVGTPHTNLDLAAVETNIVAVRMDIALADRAVELAKARGLLIGTIAPGTIRAVTHLDVTLAEVRQGAEILCEAIASAAREMPTS
jgi:threonine aldolase